MLNFYHTTILQFFKSNWTQVRASAAMFTGKIAVTRDQSVNTPVPNLL